MTMAKAVARVQWKMGQSLLPEHLIAQEESLLADAARRSALSGLPSYGVASLSWQEGQLVQGILNLSELVLVLPSGVLLEIGANTQVEPFNLSKVGVPRVSVYLHLCKNGSREYEGISPQTVKTPEGVLCWLWPVVLSASPDLDEAQETFRLAEFKKGPDDQWALAEGYIPPLLQVRNSPFLKAELDELAQQIEGYSHQLSQYIPNIHLSGENLVNAKLCWKSSIRLQRFLANLAKEIHPHPFWVLEEIKRACLDLLVYQNVPLAPLLEPYCHDHLAECFERVLTPLREHLKVRQSAPTYLPFEQAEGVVRLTLSPELKDAREVFLLIQKESISKPLNIDGLKIASKSRLNNVHRYALTGIPLARVDRPPFQHSFGPEVEIYEMALGEEWQHALRDGDIRFHAVDALAEKKFFLYWM